MTEGSEVPGELSGMIETLYDCPSSIDTATPLRGLLSLPVHELFGT